MNEKLREIASVRVPFDREVLLSRAEQGALLVHAQLAPGLKRLGAPDRDVVRLGRERVERAKAYAAWRMDAHERGEVWTPW